MNKNEHTSPAGNGKAGRTKPELVIYNPNSTGGNYNYILNLHPSLSETCNREVVLLLPKNAAIDPSPLIRKILLTDRLDSGNRLFNKLYFAWRSLLNPAILFFYILRKKPERLLFNDYDQLTSFLWAPFFLLLKRRKRFSVILHDPDRNGYFSVAKWSEWSMGIIMKLMDTAFYHEVLPQRKYYSSAITRFISIPHGIYQKQVQETDIPLSSEILKFKDGDILYGIVGNIRHEKNYELIIKAISQSGGKLIIAGSPASSSVSTGKIKELIISLKLTERVYWIEKYLKEEELHAVIRSCDIMLLYYKKTFHSQSGIINLIAPYRKKLIVSDTPSALSDVVRKFKLGVLVKPDDLLSITAVMKKPEIVMEDKKSWDTYLDYASWDRAASIVKKELLDEV